MADYLDSDFIKGTEYLNGFLKGIISDRWINELELKSLASWIDQHREDMGDTYPFDEIDYLVNEALNTKSKSIQEEIFDEITSFLKDIQKEIIILSTASNVSSKVREFKGLMAGIFADGIVTDREAFEIKKWLGENSNFMHQHWSLVELKKKVEDFLETGKITEKQSDHIISFCKIFESEGALDKFEPDPTSVEVNSSSISELTSDQEIEFDGNTFSFAGAMKLSREMAREMCLSVGARYSESVTPEVTYLVVGDQSNPRISQSTYGLKVESAMNLNIPIISEEFFWTKLKEKKD